MFGSDPTAQDELTTLEAEFRAALQHQRAAYERMQELQGELEALLRRAREILSREARPEGDASAAVTGGTPGA